ncbi:Crp/Fnr family transcriptional regulator [Flavobacterium sp. '19STA2R22 D10 B1']|uniref:Crp/Fnr family transcriptional regulator n=1 Tax=Flavobacterium aerium TaxID=3037261 RepID=UPI00278C4568|nr:cyclic nucleotide-binding domain-containing protein [Flavobacterium sp. '19STA2R22 D10 B1']
MIDPKFDFFLSRFSLFISLTDEEKQLFINRIRVVTVKKGTFLLKEGTISTHSYFVNKGLARIYHINKEGNEIISFFALEGWWANDLESFCTQTPSKKFIEVLEDSELFIISHTDYEQSFIDIPKFERYWRIIGVNSYLAHIKRLEEFQELSAVKRYKQFIKKYPELESRTKQKYIASYWVLLRNRSVLSKRSSLKKNNSLRFLIGNVSKSS